MDMKILRTAIVMVITLIMVSGGFTAHAQAYDNTPVSLSKEKVKINGQVCYSHVVLERQTLFSISKAYNVSLEDIYKYNPNLKESGLKKNSIIIIPAIENETSANEAAQTVAAETKKEAVKETATVAVQEASSPVKKVEKKKTHTVKWYETLDDIATKYGVTAEEIIAANNLEGKKIKSRMKLIIPEPGEITLTQKTGEVTDTLVNITINNETETPEVKEEGDEKIWEPIVRKEKVSAALLLPFKATGTSGSRSNMDFYSGVLLAVNDLASSGTSIDLSVFDIADNKSAISGSILNDNDIVIGPVSTRDLTDVLSVGSDNVMVISPLDPKAESLVAANSNMIQAPTPHKIQYDDLISWMKEEMAADDRVIFITEKGARQTEATFQMKQSIDSSGLAYSPFSYSILEGRSIDKPLKDLMTETGTNRVLIASESEAFVNDVVRNLNMMIHQKYNVVLYGASKIRSFETIEVENFHKTNMHVSLTYYIDYNDPRVKSFLLKYRALFNTEPSQFAFQGYDIASYFIEICSKYGKNWPEHMSNEAKSMLQSSFRCVKNGDGGYVNHGVRRIEYGKDWTISKVR
jgi:LysM repeat protein/ABC-type branched-subunit amino acid transport system substrate-binding protein